MWSAEHAWDGGQGPKLSYTELFPEGLGKDRSQAGNGQQAEGEGLQMSGRWGWGDGRQMRSGQAGNREHDGR